MAEATGRRRTVWAALGTPSAVRVVTVLMMVYALVIGALVFGYAKVQGCVTRYSDLAATSTKARAEAAAEDRELNAVAEALNDSDRLANRNADAAMNRVVQSLVAGDPRKTQAAIEALLVQQRKSAAVYAENERKRQGVRQDRQAIEERRAKTPPPPPPSETC